MCQDCGLTPWASVASTSPSFGCAPHHGFRLRMCLGTQPADTTPRPPDTAHTHARARTRQTHTPPPPPRAHIIQDARQRHAARARRPGAGDGFGTTCRFIFLVFFLIQQYRIYFFILVRVFPPRTCLTLTSALGMGGMRAWRHKHVRHGGAKSNDRPRARTERTGGRSTLRGLAGAMNSAVRAPNVRPVIIRRGCPSGVVLDGPASESCHRLDRAIA